LRASPPITSTTSSSVTLWSFGSIMARSLGKYHSLFHRASKCKKIDMAEMVIISPQGRFAPW
jgi:hypothetical protein